MARKVVCVLCALGALALYLFTGTSAALALVCAAVVLPLGSILTVAASAVRAELMLPETLQKGQQVSGEIVVKNRSILPAARVTLQLELENTLTRERICLPICISLAPLERRMLAFSLANGHCGQFQLRYTAMDIADGFELVRVRRKAALCENRLVMPELFPMHVRLTGSETPLGNEESVNLNRKGQDWSEPFQMREYVEGDSLKRIHWKLSQKLERYIVSDPSQTLDRALLVFWDLSAAGSDVPPEVPDALAEAVISFCLAVSQEGIPYRLAWSRDGGATCELWNVERMDDLYGIIPAMLRSSSGAGGGSGITECIRSLGGKRYPLIAYFGSRVPTEMDELVQVGRITLFLCSEGVELGDTGNLPCYLFSSADYRETLGSVAV